MERVNGPFSPGWETRCVHNVPITEPCAECREWRADDPPAGEIAPDGPDVIRERVSRETRQKHARDCDLTTGRYYENECTCPPKPAIDENGN